MCGCAVSLRFGGTLKCCPKLTQKACEILAPKSFGLKPSSSVVLVQTKDQLFSGDQLPARSSVATSYLFNLDFPCCCCVNCCVLFVSAPGFLSY